MKINKISLEKCKYYFDYDEKGNLYWKSLKENCKNGKAVIGGVAGHLSKCGYIKVKFENNNYMVHRILYQLYHNIELKENEEIDHINRDRSDNKKENLKLSNREKNSKNRTVSKNNLSTGLKNISIKKYKGYNYYHIRIQKNKVVKYSEIFRTDKFTEHEVIEIRNKELERLHEEDASFG